jgi:polysaccharide export outer membrane protein
MYRTLAKTRFGRGCLATLALVAAFAVWEPATAGNRTLHASELNGQLDGGYHVAAGDKLRVTVFGEATLTGEYTIGVGGDLSLPLIESIPANQHTPKQLAQMISDSLKKGGYVLDPRVAVEILEHRPFYILGEVKAPGEYPYNGDMTFEQAVARAGGFTARANRRTVSILRQDWPRQQRVKLDGEPLKIAPGDTITVNEAFF